MRVSYPNGLKTVDNWREIPGALLGVPHSGQIEQATNATRIDRAEPHKGDKRYVRRNVRR